MLPGSRALIAVETVPRMPSPGASVLARVVMMWTAEERGGMGSERGEGESERGSVELLF